MIDTKKIEEIEEKLIHVKKLFAEAKAEADYEEAKEKAFELSATVFEAAEQDPDFVDPSPNTDRLDPVYMEAVADHMQKIAETLMAERANLFDETANFFDECARLTCKQAVYYTTPRDVEERFLSFFEDQLFFDF